MAPLFRIPGTDTWLVDATVDCRYIPSAPQQAATGSKPVLLVMYDRTLQQIAVREHACISLINDLPTFTSIWMKALVESLEVDLLEESNPLVLEALSFEREEASHVFPSVQDTSEKTCMVYSGCPLELHSLFCFGQPMEVWNSLQSFSHYRCPVAIGPVLYDLRNTGFGEPDFDRNR
ncbi:hypothetical protein INT43_000524 [Umbelopsis isabellina]|uniref:Uncharacterized protein n=1 Tax=Mortierella isabellina TaxID=91625 RepID=A0A8H7Q312_MORIS|nr:hypothetical protein INT43_000524 [Umbelopsis isabellina]